MNQSMITKAQRRENERVTAIIQNIMAHVKRQGIGTYGWDEYKIVEQLRILEEVLVKIALPREIRK